MTKGVIEAKEVKKGSATKALRAVTAILGIGIAAGIALIVVTDKAMKKAEEKEE